MVSRDFNENSQYKMSKASFKLQIQITDKSDAVWGNGDNNGGGNGEI